eukprot:TRINITY_DN12161_c0_g1_i1.p1 TRINITY_DN12161_c0_g1~~TRINITY_DN12161_c0_g1_i1.p1  ORF type:complete len:164 (-),score=39.70 TRINITY_DN12161_c0_g1_i1:141-632(-)
MVKTVSPHCKCMLIGNKLDVNSERSVLAVFAQEYAEKFALPFVETSALDGSGCGKAFQWLMQDIHSQFENRDLQDYPQLDYPEDRIEKLEVRDTGEPKVETPEQIIRWELGMPEFDEKPPTTTPHPDVVQLTDQTEAKEEEQAGGDNQPGQVSCCEVPISYSS